MPAVRVHLYRHARQGPDHYSRRGRPCLSVLRESSGRQPRQVLRVHRSRWERVSHWVGADESPQPAGSTQPSCWAEFSARQDGLSTWGALRPLTTRTAAGLNRALKVSRMRRRDDSSGACPATRASATQRTSQPECLQWGQEELDRRGNPDQCWDQSTHSLAA